MAKRRTFLTVFILCLYLFSLPFYASAASTSNAKENISLSEKTSLTISYTYNEIAFSGVEVKLYKIANLSKNCEFSFTESFKNSNLTLNGITSADEWNIIRSTLENFIFSNNIEAKTIKTTDQSGSVFFDSLEIGLYLAVSENVIKDNTVYYLDSALITLPTLNENALWQYDVKINSKVEAIPTPSPEEKTEYKISKLWQGDNIKIRPKSIEVEIYNDKTLYKKVTLSKENNWSYSWAEKSGFSWTVVENCPESYVMTISQSNNTFVITNTLKTNAEENEDNNENTPQTGDTSNILPYIIIMNISGAVLIILGIIRKRKSV